MAFRIDRINAEMVKSISLTIQNKIKDPRISGGMISVTAVDCAKDLKTAKVFISIFGGDKEERAGVFSAICSSGGFIRKELSSDLRAIRTVPQLSFFLDDSGEYGSKIDSILQELKEK